MGSTRALLLAGAMALGLVNAAQAADLPPPPPIFVPPPEPVAYGGWYLRGDVGAGIASSPDFRSSFYADDGSAVTVPGFGRDSQRISDSAIIGGGIGYQFNNWLRLDATGEYRTSQQLNTLVHYDAATGYNAANGTVIPTPQNAFDEYNGQVQSSVFLVNAYADLGTWYGMTPFLGAGVGFAYNHLSAMTDRSAGVDLTDGTFAANGSPTIIAANYGGGGFGRAAGKDKLDLAWAGIAGLSYSINRNLKLEISYRYLDMGSIRTGLYQCTAGCTHETQKIHLASNDIRLGLRWLINDYAPAPVYMPPEQPIIRKD